MRPSLVQDLELDRVIELVAAHARTGMGRSLLRATVDLPSVDEAGEAAALTLETAALLVDDGAVGLRGLDPAVELLTPGQAPSLEPEDLVAQLTLARTVAAVRRRLLKAPDELGRLKALGLSLPDTEPLLKTVAPLLGRDGRVPDEATPELARLRQLQVRTRHQLLQELEALRRSHPDVVNDAPPTLRRDRYCLAVKASSRSALPGLVLDMSATGVTAFVEPFPVVELNNTLATAQAGEREEMRRILAEVAAVFTEVAEDLMYAAQELARLDAAQARVLFGQRSQGRVVVPGDGQQLAIRGARHPLLDPLLSALRIEIFAEKEQRAEDSKVVPLDLILPEHLQTMLISGPNAGGKTVALKTVGLVVLMAYQGIPVPVDEGTTIPCFDGVWCHIGDEQDVAADLSTFSGAMLATGDLLRATGDCYLVLYDELGAGTDPLEGAALGCALLEELTRRSWLTVATTHLAGIAMNASNHDGMDNAAMEYDERLSRPTYELRVGRPGRSRALEIADAVGVSAGVIERARELLGGQHLELDRWLRRLESLEAELLDERTALDRGSLELERSRQEIEDQRTKLELELDTMRATHKDDRERLKRQAKLKLDEAMAELTEAIREHRHLGRRRQEAIRQKALDLQSLAPEAAADEELVVGMPVRLRGLGTEGEVQEVRGQQVLVMVKGKRLWVQASQVERRKTSSKSNRRAGLAVELVEAVPAELLLLGKDGEAAREELERYLDRALAVGRSMVRVVHGHGTGVLKRVVSEVCRSHPAVRSFCHPPRARGGAGATEVIIDHGEGGSV